MGILFNLRLWTSNQSVILCGSYLGTLVERGSNICVPRITKIILSTQITSTL